MLNDSKALLLGLAWMSLLVGCGGSTPKLNRIHEARVVAEVNAFCRYASSLPLASHRSAHQTGAIQKRLASLSSALRQAAADLSAGRDLNEARAARRALFHESNERSSAGRAQPGTLNVRFERLQLRIYDDELALGITCSGVAQAAHETARILATSAR